eukprot:GHRQ01018400.1.p3 GENE.GHRQ01018400.1~~GHRQ01018400.1.p3  ORF type:complete len:112 (+),score=10.13 GHRQ01018400.1:1076-1411(+)
MIHVVSFLYISCEANATKMATIVLQGTTTGTAFYKLQVKSNVHHAVAALPYSLPLLLLWSEVLNALGTATLPEPGPGPAAALTACLWPCCCSKSSHTCAPLDQRECRDPCL